MRGKENPADPARAYPGNRPSTTILIDELTPHALGALIAFYEHRTFSNGILMGINSFDQFGVELGKDIARAFNVSTVFTLTSSLAAIARLLYPRAISRTTCSSRSLNSISLTM